MRKVIASINITLDGFCDHTLGIANEEVHRHYTDMLNSAGTLLYGRTTYKLMEDFWPTLIKKPSGEKHMDDFANAIDRVPKILFTRTLKNVSWNTTRIAKKELSEEVKDLRQQPGNDIFVGSPSLISALTELKLIDEFQLMIHPVIGGRGLILFKTITAPVNLKLIKSKTFNTAGHILLYHQPLYS
jgi:dihydrofolate reductase